MKTVLSKSYYVMRDNILNTQYSLRDAINENGMEAY